MSLLKVLLEGRELYSLTLAKGRDYIVGRADNCDIVLNKSSISRQHMKIFFNGESWQIEVTSRYSNFTYKGHDINQLILTDGQIFVVEGYEFRFVEEKPKVEPTVPVSIEPQKPKEEVPDVPPVEGQLLSPDGTDTRLKNEVSQQNEHTALATQVASACLHAINESTGEEVLFTLDGSHWIAGRSSACQIRLSETKASRQHFELCRTTTGFEIIDLGSSNGTFLNNKKLTPQVRTPMSLGDEIRIGKTVLIFEMRNPNFEEQLAKIPTNIIAEDESDENFLPQPPTNDYFPVPLRDAPAVIKYNGPLGTESSSKNDNLGFRVGIAAAICVVIWLALSDKKESGTDTGPSLGPISGNKPPTLDSLSSEQKKLAESTYQLAKSLFIQQKHQSAKTEVNKLHAMVPFYKDSREMEKYIDQAIQIELDRTRIAELQEKQRQATEQVKAVVKDCSTQLKTTTTVVQIRSCLQPALELDPENKEVQALIDKAQSQEDIRKQNQIARETKEFQIRKGLLIFAEAQKAENKKDYLQAIDLYNKFANSNLPDPQNNKTKARSAVASINSKIRAGISQILSKAEQLRSQEKYRDAYQALTQAMKWDPSDTRILQAMTTVESELKKKMKALYNDGVLEENIGNLEAAKQKWRVIRDQDLENGEYHRKAVSKLKRYGD